MNARYLIKRVSDSGTPLIDIDEAKLYLKVTHTKEDSIILNLIERVINDMEGYMYASLQSSTYKLLTESWWDGCIPVTRGPVATISLVQYYDEANALKELGASNYFLAEGTPDFVTRAFNVTWPTIYRRQDAVQVTYTTNPVVESKVKSRLLQAVAYMYENRSSLGMPLDRVYQSIVQGAGRRHFIK